MNCNDKEKTPYELLSNEKPNLIHLHVLGCQALVLNDKSESKLEEKTLNGVLVGYGNNERKYIIYLLQEGRIIETQSVKFIEAEFPFKKFEEIKEMNEMKRQLLSLLPEGEDEYSEDENNYSMAIDTITYEAALKSEEKEEWKKAIELEVQSFKQHNAYSLVEKTSRRNATNRHQMDFDLKI